MISRILLAVFLFLSSTTLAFAKECGKVTIADMNWGSATLMANIDKIILEKGYDCEVELVLGDTVPTFTSMKDKGAPDIAPELWASTVSTLLQQAEAQGKLHVLNASPIIGLGEGWFVTPATLERHPELKTVQDIINNPQLFPHPEDPSKGAFVTCPSGWGCQKSNMNLFRAFEMDKKGWKLLDPGSSAGLDGTIAKASARDQNWFGFYWTPTALAGKYNMVMMDWGIEYAGDDNWNNCIVKTVHECPEPKATAWTIPVVSTVVTQNFLDKAGTDAINFIKDRVWSSDVLNRQLDEMESNQMDGKAAAISFLKTKTNVWKEWVNEEAFKKITASL